MMMRLGVVCLLAACSASAPVAPPKSADNGDKTITSPPPPAAEPPADPAFAPAAPATIALGEHSSCAINSKKRVVCWGGNDTGELGDGTNLEASSLVEVAGVDDVIEIGAGAGHACARTEDGSVWCWGGGSDFRLGSQAEGGPHKAQRAVEHAISIDVGDEHSCAVIVDGKVRCWGSPEDGRLGLDHLDHVTEPTIVTMDVEGATGVAVGTGKTCVRDRLGDVYCWGLPTPDGDSDEAHIKQKVALDQVVELDAGGRQMCARNKLNEIYCFSNATDPTPPKEGPAKGQRLALGGHFGCAVTGEAISCWGSYPGEGADERYLEEPVRTFDRIIDPQEVRAGDNHMCARIETGEIFCWGSNTRGQLGQDPGTATTRPHVIDFAAKAKALSLGDDFSCALGRDAKVRCWGDSGLGSLGGGRYDAAKNVVARVDSASALVAGDAHSCAVHDRGKVACWGWASYGQLGREAAPPPADSGEIPPPPPPLPGMSRSARMIVQVEGVSDASHVGVSRKFSCALTPSGVLCWGDSGLQPGATVPKPRPRRHAFALDDPAQRSPCDYRDREDDCTAAKTARPLRGSQGATALESTEEMQCALLGGDKVGCWTRDRLVSGQMIRDLKVPDVVSLHGGIDEMCAIDASGKLWCWNDHPMRPKQRDEISEPIVDWAGNDDHQCAVSKKGRVLCWGSGESGQLGDGRLVSVHEKPHIVKGIEDAVAVDVGNKHSCALSKDGTVRCWGSGSAQMLKKAAPRSSLTPWLVEGID